MKKPVYKENTWRWFLVCSAENIINNNDREQIDDLRNFDDFKNLVEGMAIGWLENNWKEKWYPKQIEHLSAVSNDEIPTPSKILAYLQYCYKTAKKSKNLKWS